MATDLRFRVSTRRLVRAALKRWWALVPTVLLGSLDVVERATDETVNAPAWLTWLVLVGGIALAFVLAHHDVRLVEARELAGLALPIDLGSSCRTVAEDLHAFLDERPTDAAVREAQQDVRLSEAEDERPVDQQLQVAEAGGETRGLYEEQFAGRVYPIVDALRARGDLTNEEVRRLNHPPDTTTMWQVVHTLETMCRRLGG